MFIDDVIYVYVDFTPIVSSTSPDDGLELLLAMYAVFELNFNKNSRTIRLLYGIVFNDKRFLSNTIRSLLHEKQIYISLEQNRKKSNIFHPSRPENVIFCVSRLFLMLFHISVGSSHLGRVSVDFEKIEIFPLFRFF